MSSERASFAARRISLQSQTEELAPNRKNGGRATLKGTHWGLLKHQIIRRRLGSVHQNSTARSNCLAF
jgi:hypothetical protein